MVMTPQILEGILAHMENVMNNLAKEAIENMEIEENIKGVEDFKINLT